uniref:Transmembrane protein n=1 Tax=Parascaris univalens TaxID=6257 RepID=A0A914ZSK3_PARUN
MWIIIVSRLVGYMAVVIPSRLLAFGRDCGRGTTLTAKEFEESAGSGLAPSFENHMVGEASRCKFIIGKLLTCRETNFSNIGNLQISCEELSSKQFSYLDGFTSTITLCGIDMYLICCCTYRLYSTFYSFRDEARLSKRIR